MSESYIYNGVWVNWSRGPILGWTLTLAFKQAQLLTAFLAVYVTVAGSQFWKILSYLIHQSRAAPTPGDGRHQQVQAILRNTGTPLSASWELMKLGRPWRKVAPSGFGPILILALIGVFHSAGWGLAGVFSSSVTKTYGDEALIRGSNCGWYSTPHGSNDTGFLRSKTVNATVDAATYARLCYGTSQQKSFCNQYTVPRIPWFSNANSSCPFDPEFCVFNGTAAAFEMDTGLLDSNDVFGINTPLSKRIGYRRVTTCAPLHPPSRFVQPENKTGSLGIETFVHYYFGPTSATNSSYDYKVTDYDSGSGYQIYPVQAIASASANSWDPIPELNRTDADVTLFFLAPGAVGYDEPVDDPWFSAHILEQFPPPLEDTTYYVSDYYVRVLGCIEQHQFCKLDSKGGVESCTPLTGQELVLSAIEENLPSFSQIPLAIVERFLINLLPTSIVYSVTSETSLQAFNSLWNNQIVSLPNNQWQIEVTNWYNIALVKLQAWLVEYSSGPSSIRKGGTVFPPSNIYDQALCFSQKVHQSSSHTSFSLLGVLIILVLGGFIIFVSLFIDTLVGFFQRRFHKGEHKTIQWALDEKLQLQRMVYEKEGIGSWENCDRNVPTTTEEVPHMGVVVQDQDGRHPSYGWGVDEFATDSLFERSQQISLLEERQHEELKKGGYVSYRPVSPISPAMRY